MIDTHARKLLLLTRIAAERQELVADLRQLRSAASLPSILRSAVGPGFLSDLLGKKPGRRGTGSGGWLDLALTMVKRYRVAATLAGSLLSLVRRRKESRRRGGGLRRLLLLAVVGGAALAGWKFTKTSAGSPPAP